MALATYDEGTFPTLLELGWMLGTQYEGFPTQDSSKCVSPEVLAGFFFWVLGYPVTLWVTLYFSCGRGTACMKLWFVVDGAEAFDGIFRFRQLFADCG